MGYQKSRGILGADEESSKEKKFQRIKSIYPGEKTYFVCDTMGDILEARNSGIDVIIGVGWGWPYARKISSCKTGLRFRKN